MRAVRAGAVLTAAVACVGLTATAALAQWTTTGRGSGAASTTTINAPATATAAGTSPTSVTVTVPAAPSSGAPVQGYRVDRTSPSAASGVCFITGTTGSCAATASGSGEQTYSVVSYRRTSILQYWQSAPLAGVKGTPTSAPTVAVSQPTANQNFANNGAMNNNCTTITGVCGTATAGTGTLGAGALTLTLRRTVGSAVTFWNGSAWVATSTTLTATGTTSWTYSVAYTALRTGVSNGTSASYLVTATVTDSLGATGTAQRTFTTS